MKVLIDPEWENVVKEIKTPSALKNVKRDVLISSVGEPLDYPPPPYKGRIE